MKRRYLGYAVLTVGLVASLTTTPASAAVITYHIGAAWGDNAYYTLGDGTSTSRPTYVDVKTLTTATQLSGGQYDSMALTKDGTVWTWGLNASGELGTGTLARSSATPKQLPGLSEITHIAAGYDHNLALASNGTVWAWGNNAYGELGDGTYSQRNTPVKVLGLGKVVQIAAGYRWSMALQSDGTVWAWGYNIYWQLGNPNIADSATPIKINGLSSVTAISAGESFGMAIETTGSPAVHTVWTWGQDSNGEIGNGTIYDPFSTGGIYVPVHVVGIPDAVGIAAGGHFGAVLGSDQSVWEWGGDWGDVLGGGSESLSPVLTRDVGSTLTQISAGDAYMLGLMGDGTVVAWGDNREGQLGNPSVTTQSGGSVHVLNLTSVTQIDAGYDFGLAVHNTPVVAK